MGKIRVKTIGDENQEQEEQKKAQEKRDQKALRQPKAKGHLKNMGGGQRITTVGPTEEELAQIPTKPQDAGETTEEKTVKKKKEKFVKKKILSKRHTENKNLVLKNKNYDTSEAVAMLSKFKKSSFDETVELHINVKEKGISGQIALPHGTGKIIKIKIADDTLIAEVEKGKIDFDILVATPQMMPKLAKIAKILGPRGLMPNPKNGTITDMPEDAVKKLSAGQVNYKTEPVAPVVHLCVGKASFDEKKLEDNIKTAISSIGSARINSAVLKSTMSPAIRLNLSKFS